MPGKATAVIGMRRAGKTTFLQQLRIERLSRGIPRESLPYLSFEDERLAGLQADQLSFLWEEYYRSHPSQRDQIVTWCLDEIQLVPGWERFVRRALDSEQVEIFLSGSSAALLSREVATSMRGRGWTVVLHPFSFAEYLDHRQLRPQARTSSGRSALEHHFLEFLRVGGFPEAQGLDEASRRQLLTDYVDVAVLRDVVERHAVTNVIGLKWLVRQLLGNAAALFSVEKFYGAAKSQGLSVSRDTLHQALAYLDDCFLVRVLWMESDSERQRMVNPRKCYPIDTGLIPLYDRTGRANRGHALETAVALELERRRAALTWVRTPGGFEVDLLARNPDGAEELIQVCADASDPATAERELRALEEAGERFPHATRRLLTLTRDGLPARLPSNVIGQPAYEWMLL